MDVPINKITLRKYEKIESDNEKLDVIINITNSLGLSQPGDNINIVSHVILFLEEQKQKKELISSFDLYLKIKEKLKNTKRSDLSFSNVRRYLKILRNMHIVERIGNKYRISEFMTLKEVFSQKVKKIIIEPTLYRIEENLNYYNQKYE